MFKPVIQLFHSDKREKKGDPFLQNSKYFITGVGLKMEPLKCQQSAGALKGQPLRRRCSWTRAQPLCYKLVPFGEQRKEKVGAGFQHLSKISIWPKKKKSRTAKSKNIVVQTAKWHKTTPLCSGAGLRGGATKFDMKKHVFFSLSPNYETQNTLDNLNPHRKVCRKATPHPTAPPLSFWEQYWLPAITARTGWDCSIISRE